MLNSVFVSLPLSRDVYHAFSAFSYAAKKILKKKINKRLLKNTRTTGVSVFFAITYGTTRATPRPATTGNTRATKGESSCWTAVRLPTAGRPSDGRCSPGSVTRARTRAHARHRFSLEKTFTLQRRRRRRPISSVLSPLPSDTRAARHNIRVRRHKVTNISAVLLLSGPGFHAALKSTGTFALCCGQ